MNNTALTALATELVTTADDPISTLTDIAWVAGPFRKAYGLGDTYTLPEVITAARAFLAV